VDHLRHSEFVVVVGIHDEGNVGSEQQMFEVERFANHFNFNYKSISGIYVPSSFFIPKISSSLNRQQKRHFVNKTEDCQRTGYRIRK